MCVWAIPTLDCDTCRFKYEWLKEDYNSEDKVNRQRDLYAISESEKKALLGIHAQDYRKGLVNKPSPDDIMLLNELYTYGII